MTPAGAKDRETGDKRRKESPRKSYKRERGGEEEQREKRDSREGGIDDPQTPQRPSRNVYLQALNPAQASKCPLWALLKCLPATVFHSYCKDTLPASCVSPALASLFWGQSCKPNMITMISIFMPLCCLNMPASWAAGDGHVTGFRVRRPVRMVATSSPSKRSETARDWPTGHVALAWTCFRVEMAWFPSRCSSWMLSHLPAGLARTSWPQSARNPETSWMWLWSFHHLVCYQKSQSSEGGIIVPKLWMSLKHDPGCKSRSYGVTPALKELTVSCENEPHIHS